MNQDKERQNQEAWEIRVVACLLGEASPFEASEIQERLKQDAELAAFFGQMRQTIRLVEQASKKADGAIPQPEAPPKLSAERRSALLAKLKTPQAEPAAPPKIVRGRTRWIVPVSLAASLFIVMGAFMMFVVKPRKLYELVELTTALGPRQEVALVSEGKPVSGKMPAVAPVAPALPASDSDNDRLDRKPALPPAQTGAKPVAGQFAMSDAVQEESFKSLEPQEERRRLASPQRQPVEERYYAKEEAVRLGALAAGGQPGNKPPIVAGAEIVLPKSEPSKDIASLSWVTATPETLTRQSQSQPETRRAGEAPSDTMTLGSGLRRGSAVRARGEDDYKERFADQGPAEKYGKAFALGASTHGRSSVFLPTEGAGVSRADSSGVVMHGKTAGVEKEGQGLSQVNGPMGGLGAGTGSIGGGGGGGYGGFAGGIVGVESANGSGVVRNSLSSAESQHAIKRPEFIGRPMMGDSPMIGNLFKSREIAAESKADVVTGPTAKAESAPASDARLGFDLAKTKSVQPPAAAAPSLPAKPKTPAAAPDRSTAAGVVVDRFRGETGEESARYHFAERPVELAETSKIAELKKAPAVTDKTTTLDAKLNVRLNAVDAESALRLGNDKGAAQPAREKQVEALAEELDLGLKRDGIEPAAVPEPQPEIITRENAFSTFSFNVSDVSFKLAAASLEQGVMPEPAVIRSEEFINAFDYHDPEPGAGERLAFAWARARYPFAHNRDILRFAIKTAVRGREPGKPLNIVVLLDTSGSMERADRVKIVQEALKVLAGRLQPQDKISLVAFARTARLWVDGLPGGNPQVFLEKALGLNPHGGTNFELALELAYAVAQKHFLPGANNRVIMLTDGAANLGNVDPDALKKIVELNRQKGIALDCFGVGWEGYNDDLLEVLSRNGDGRYGFLNRPDAAALEFADQLTGALEVSAADVKAQVEFNPGRVISYRQIGYAKHQLTKEQFRDDTVDAAEIGAAESANALYVIQVNPRGTGPIGIVRVRFKAPATGQYLEETWPVPYQPVVARLEDSSPAMRLAVTAATFAEWLAGNPYVSSVGLGQLTPCLNGVPDVYAPEPRPKQLEWMIRQTRSITGQ